MPTHSSCQSAGVRRRDGGVCCNALKYAFGDAMAWKIDRSFGWVHLVSSQQEGATVVLTRQIDSIFNGIGGCRHERSLD